MKTVLIRFPFSLFMVMMFSGTVAQAKHCPFESHGITLPQSPAAIGEILERDYGLSLHNKILSRNNKTTYVYSNQPAPEADARPKGSGGRQPPAKKVAPQFPLLKVTVGTRSAAPGQNSAHINTDEIVEIIWKYQVSRENRNIYDIWGKTETGQYMEARWKEYCTGIESRKMNESGTFLAIQEVNAENGFTCNMSSHGKGMSIHTPMRRYGCLVRVQANATEYNETMGLIDWPDYGKK